MTNFGAGVETIAITVSTFICHVLDSPGCQARIHAELDAAHWTAGSRTPRMGEMRGLEWLNACLRESMRLHHVLGMPLPRVVPEGGAELEGWKLPAGVSFEIRVGVQVQAC